MAKKQTAVAEPVPMRRCIGSKTFGIEAHDAPLTDFPVQPSQKDGIGRMCKPHWTQYTGALRKASLARKAEQTEATEPAKPAAEAKPARERTTSQAAAREQANLDDALAPALAGKGRRTRKAVAAALAPTPDAELAPEPEAPAQRTGVGSRAFYAKVNSMLQDAPAEVPAEVQDAPAEVAASESTPELVGPGAETALGETIDAGTEEADAATTD
jgi:hypothetical protein